MLEKKFETEIWTTLVYKFYVDGNLVIIGYNKFPDQFMKNINCLHPNIKVTCEEESIGCLALVDIMMQKRYDETLQKACLFQGNMDR